MKPLEIAREGVKGVRARFGHSVVTIMVVALAMCVPAAMEYQARAEIAQELNADIAAGAAVFVVTAQDGSLSSTACEATAGQTGVIGAGLIYSMEIVRLRQAPGVPIQLAHVSPRLLSILDGTPGAAVEQVVAGSAIARELDLSSGQLVRVVSTSSEPAASSQITKILTDTARDADRARWMFAVERRSPSAAECWVEAEAANQRAVLATLPWRFGELVTVDTLARSRFEDLEARWDNRPSRILWLAGAAIGTVVLGLGVFARRDELALYMLSGAPRGSAVLVIGIGGQLQVLISLLSSLLGVGAAILTHGVTSAAQVAAWTILAVYASVVLCSLLVCALASSGDLSRMARNRG